MEKCLKFTDKSTSLNFEVRKVVFVYDRLNDYSLKIYEDLDTTVIFNEHTLDIFIPTDWYSQDYWYSTGADFKFTDSIPSLNFNVKQGLKFTESLGTQLNFAIHCYNEEYVLYRVLLDFIENRAVGDVFAVIDFLVS